MKRSLAGMAILASLLAAGPAAAQASLTVDFSWSGIAACGTKPPAFKIGGIPAATKKLRFAMKDLDKPGFDHGGGTIDYAGGAEIAAGAFFYTGPCPPGGTHRYQWTVQALDAAGRVIAAGQATKPFPPR
ncbi:MAG: YbhB/YbcL family Raf kinase inhibitor-like protein [Alphaproteobacteria bacterium]